MEERAYVIFADSGPGIIVRGTCEDDVIGRLRFNREFALAAMGAVEFAILSDREKAGAIARGLDYMRVKRMPTKLEGAILAGTGGGPKLLKGRG